MKAVRFLKKSLQSISNPSKLRSRVRTIAVALERSLGITRQRDQLPDPLEMLIATILSQNTNDKNSHRAYVRLKEMYPGWDKLAKAPLQRIKTAIRIGGMANQKSLRIKQTLAVVHRRFGVYDLVDIHTMTDDQVIEELTAIKGVGVKTASCVLLFSMGRDVFPVDTHVHRICNRLGFVDTKTPEQTFHQMHGFFPKGKGYTFHTNLIRFGRSICRSNNPTCGSCPISGMCTYEAKNFRQTLPLERSRKNRDFMLLDNIQFPS
ncbi:MAG: endonuclease III domain-containing protein [Bacteroidota bacterium]